MANSNGIILYAMYRLPQKTWIKIIFGLVELDCSKFFCQPLSTHMKQHVDMLVNCLYDTSVLFKFGTVCQEWKTLLVCGSLNVLLRLLICPGM